MIPRAYITEWFNEVPWQTNEQVEQDLVICRALVKIFSDAFLAKSLALSHLEAYDLVKTALLEKIDVHFR
jgi:hypothetical protein